MSEALQPRDYQRAAIQALHSGWKNGLTRPAVVLPTGSGKTVVFAHLILGMLANLNGRALVIAHREELLHQAAAKIRAVAPHLRVGIVKAEKDEHLDVDVVVASIQTLAVEKRREAITGIGLVIVDEAHHAAARTYVEVLRHFGCFDSTPAAGFTATMKREDGGLAEVWEEVVYTRDILEMIADRYLVDVRGKQVVVGGLNLDAVKTRHGDLQDGQLSQALTDSGAATVVADAYVELAKDRPGVIFTPTVDTAHAMTDAMNAVGIPTATVWGDMPKQERAAALKAYEAGDIQVLSNCMVLTEGFDAPWASCAVIARPTKSAALYVQMVGRVLRPWEGKKDALVLDVAGASTRHKLASIVDLTGYEIGTPEDGQSLAEAALDNGHVDIPGLRNIAVDWQDINLFTDSAVRWLRTRGGTWFIPAGDDLFFLVPGEESQSYRIRRWAPARGVWGPNPDPEYPLGFAMRWAESYAQRVAPHLARKAARWRSGAPSQKQLAFCRFKGIVVPRSSTAGDVSDLQSVFLASSRIDGRSKAA